MFSLTIREKRIDVFPAADPGRPIVYLHTFGREGSKVYRALQNGNCPDFTLAAVSHLAWDHDMTPWDCPPISRFDTPCTGGADEYLQILLEEIMPEVEKRTDVSPAWRGIAGYSLAGLFAVYAAYRTDRFSRIASMSGSLWFPDFKDFVLSHEMRIRPDVIYLSLGDKEAKTNNPYLKTVQENTEAIKEYYVSLGLDAVFHLNPGNHYVHGAERTAAGIEHILSRKEMSCHGHDI